MSATPKARRTTSSGKQTITCGSCARSVVIRLDSPGQKYRDKARRLGWRFSRHPKGWTCPDCRGGETG